MTTLYRAADPVAEQACMINVASAKNSVGPVGDSVKLWRDRIQGLHQFQTRHADGQGSADHPHLGEEVFLMRQLCTWMTILGSIFLGIAIIETIGKIILDFPQVPYLTKNIVGPFDYALAYAIVLYAARWVLKTIFDLEDDE